MQRQQKGEENVGSVIQARPVRPHREEERAAASAVQAGSHWREDLGAGLVVFLVALPLCLGIALASGAPLASGLVTGVVGGLMVSRLSGSALMVSGPAAGLTAIVLAAIAELGSFEVFLCAVFLAGAMQMVMGLLRAGVIGSCFPSSVIRAMLVGIGLILLIKQLPYGAGLTSVQAGQGYFPQFAQAEPLAVALTAVSLLLMATWARVVPAGVRRGLPAPLAVVLLGALASALATAFAPQWALPPQAMVTLPVPRSGADLAAYFHVADWGVLVASLGSLPVLEVAVTLAIVASLESLLSLEATDRLDPLKRVSSPHRELLAQGAGNMVCGLIGGLPMTGVIVRSAANVEAGGRTWRSSFIHGVFLLVAVGSVPAWFQHIPLASLAAVLIYTGFKLAHPSQAADALRRGHRYALPFFVTVLAILGSDLLRGIGAGLAVSLIYLLWDGARNACTFDPHQAEDPQQVLLTLAEEVTFLNKARIQSVLRGLPDGAQVTVDATRSKHLDPDVIELLHSQLQSAHERGIRMVLKGVPGVATLAGHAAG